MGNKTSNDNPKNEKEIEENSEEENVEEKIEEEKIEKKKTKSPPKKTDEKVNKQATEILIKELQKIKEMGQTEGFSVEIINKNLFKVKKKKNFS